MTVNTDAGIEFLGGRVSPTDALPHLNFQRDTGPLPHHSPPARLGRTRYTVASAITQPVRMAANHPAIAFSGNGSTPAFAQRPSRCLGFVANNQSTFQARAGLPAHVPRNEADPPSERPRPTNSVCCRGICLHDVPMRRPSLPRKHVERFAMCLVAYSYLVREQASRSISTIDGSFERAVVPAFRHKLLVWIAR